jgi:hypothetical protein
MGVKSKVAEADRRTFIKMGLMTAGATLVGGVALGKGDRVVRAHHFAELAQTELVAGAMLHHPAIEWREIAKGLWFSRTPVYRRRESGAEELVDVIAAARMDPRHIKLRVLNSYDPKGTIIKGISAWQQDTGAYVIINGPQFLAKPENYPCALVISDGRRIGPRHNKLARGVFLAEPTRKGLPYCQIIELRRQSFDPDNVGYSQGTMHWPLLFSRAGKVEVKPTLWQASRTAVGVTKDDQLLFLNTEGGFFTLYNFGAFIRDNAGRGVESFNLAQLLNMDGGWLAGMRVETPEISYVTDTRYETRGPAPGIKPYTAQVPIPCVLGMFPR